MPYDVLIISGSKNDLANMEPCYDTLEELGLTKGVVVASAHRTPKKVETAVRTAAELDGAKVIIATAGMAAALPGVVAAITNLPVIGVPQPGPMETGLDSILSMVQMPGGVPVATVAIGKQGAKNAAVLAARIIALYDPEIKENLDKYVKNMQDSITGVILVG